MTIAVIFETETHAERAAAYFDLAAELRPLLDGVDGFVSIERFQSLATPGKILSLSFWRDEEAVLAWRNTGAHRAAQRRGRADILRGYRLRVCAVLRDYRHDHRDGAPHDSVTFHD